MWATLSLSKRRRISQRWLPSEGVSESEGKDDMNGKKAAKMTRTSEGLRDVLFAELAALQGGKTTHQKSTAVAKLADSICSTVRMEMDYYRLVGSKLGLAGVPLKQPLKLGQ